MNSLWKRRKIDAHIHKHEHTHHTLACTCIISPHHTHTHTHMHRHTHRRRKRKTSAKKTGITPVSTQCWCPPGCGRWPRWSRWPRDQQEIWWGCPRTQGAHEWQLSFCARRRAMPEWPVAAVCWGHGKSPAAPVVWTSPHCHTGRRSAAWSCRRMWGRCPPSCWG